MILDKENARRFEGETDSQGCFHLGGIVAPGRYEYGVTVEADDFGSLTAEVPTLKENLLEVQLEPSGSAAQGVIRKSEGPIPCR